MSIICPGHGYHEALDIMNFKELAIHHDEMCETLFDTIVNNNNHRLYKLLPATHETFNVPRDLLTYQALKPTVLRIVLLSLHVLELTLLRVSLFSRVDPFNN